VLALPTREAIYNQILKEKNLAQDNYRRRYIKSLFRYTKRDTIIYASAFSSSFKIIEQIPSFAISIVIDDINGFMQSLHGLKGRSLDLILHSPGGNLEASTQIIQYLRSKYEHIRTIIPQNAMSAATMMACASDVIIMGKHSAIGPIDPQITFETTTGHYHTAPAQSIIDDFENAKEEVLKNPKTSALWARKIIDYPYGFLKQCENTVKLAQKTAEKWLNQYMFKGKQPDLSKKIAKWLSSTNEHLTHGRPISMKLAQEKGLKVEALEDDQNLQEKVLSLFHSTLATFDHTPCVKLIENHEGKGIYMRLTK